MRFIRRPGAASLSICLVCLGAWLAAASLSAQSVDVGRHVFETTCARCHGSDGMGGEMGPNITVRLTAHDVRELTALIHDGLPGRGMPGNALSDAETASLLAYLRTIARQPRETRTTREFRTSDGRTLDGYVLGEGLDDLQVQTADGHLHLLRRAGAFVREVTSQESWPTYNGDPGGNRYTTLTEINPSTVADLHTAWIFPVPNADSLQVTPVVVAGVMYVTAPNECVALDAGTGRLIWRYQRQPTPGAVAGNANRGVSVAGTRVFMETGDAHIIALNRETGALLWDTQLADWRENYGASSAPLVAGNLVISGVSGGEHGANGFVAAHDQVTGKEVWRFWTVPKPGEPKSETWQGKDIAHGGAPTWFTGSYDPDLDLVYWPVGNPSKEYNGDDRGGDNLYSDSLLALDRKTGALKWFYQFTPHDLWDWDSTETSVIVDADWAGQPRQLILHADRNGFFYVFDRTNGALLLAKPFLRNITWASGISADGRPIKLPDQAPTPAGTRVCPSQDGATNWFSPSFNPGTGLYYVQTFEKCSIYTKEPGGEWVAGKTYLGGTQHTGPDPDPQRVLKAIDIRTGTVRWEFPQAGPATTWGGTLTTASGLVIFCAEGGELVAADATSGKPLWRLPLNAAWKASPMVYAFDGVEHIAVAAGANIVSLSIR